MDALKLGPNNRLYLHRQYYCPEVAWSLFEKYNLITLWSWRDSARADVGEQLLNCAQEARINQDAQKDTLWEDYYKFRDLHREIDNYSDKEWGKLTGSRISIFFSQLTMRPDDIVILPNPYDLSDVRVVRLISPIKHSSQLPTNLSIEGQAFSHTEQGLAINGKRSTLNYFAEVEPVDKVFKFNRYAAPYLLQSELRYFRGTNKELDRNLIKEVQEALDANNPLLQTKKALIANVSSLISSYTKGDLLQLASRYLTRCGANKVTCDLADKEAFTVTGSFFNLGLNINVAVKAAADGNLTADVLPPVEDGNTASQAQDDDANQTISWLITNLPLEEKISEDVLKQARTAHVRIIALEELASLILNAGTDLLANSSK